MKAISVIFFTMLLSLPVFSQSIKYKTVDKQLTKETAALYNNIFSLQEKGMMIGQHDGVWMQSKGIVSHMSNLTEKHPAMVCYDFMHITNKRNIEGSWFRVREHEIRENIVAVNRQGLYVTMCWHYNDPYTGNTFYIKELPNEELKQNSFKSILEGGVNHEVFKKDLRKIADFSKSLVDDNGKPIPYIFRPFHEFDGEWFWWGEPYNTPEEFKSIWQFTVHYLRDSLNVHNILYAFSPDVRFNSEKEYLIRYPGDDYVDIIGFDDYEDFKYDRERAQKAKDRIKIVGEIGRIKNKPVALTEVGYFILRNDMKETDRQRTKWMLEAISEMKDYLAYIVFWSNGGHDYCVPKKGQVGETEFLQFLNQPFIIMNEDKNDCLR